MGVVAEGVEQDVLKIGGFGVGVSVVAVAVVFEGFSGGVGGEEVGEASVARVSRAGDFLARRNPATRGGARLERLGRVADCAEREGRISRVCAREKFVSRFHEEKRKEKRGRRALPAAGERAGRGLRERRGRRESQRVVGVAVWPSLEDAQEAFLE